MEKIFLNMWENNYNHLMLKNRFQKVKEKIGSVILTINPGRLQLESAFK